jgi:GNAT superfamily N-acetyltransferase
VSDAARALHGVGARPADLVCDDGPRLDAGQTPLKSPLAIRVRPARPEDRAAVMTFATRTWDGWDYIPHAWNEWLDASDGVVLVALPAGSDTDADGRPLDPSVPIAMSRVALLSADEAWLEGIRVDPRVRGRSVATHLQIAELTWAAAHGCSVIRYITGENNEGSHRLGARHGFTFVGAWRGYVDDQDDDEPDEEPPVGDDDAGRWIAEAGQAARVGLLDTLVRRGFAVDPDAGAQDLDRLWAVVADDATFRLGRGLYERRPWTLQSLTRERFEAHVRRAEVVVDGGDAGDGTTAVAIIVRDAVTAEDPRPHLSLLAGDGTAALRLAAAIRDHAGEPVRLRLPDPDPPLIGDRGVAWQAAGYPTRAHVNHLLERPIAGGPPLPEPSAGGMLEYLETPRAIAIPADR